jgi:hypothetical protein
VYNKPQKPKAKFAALRVVAGNKRAGVLRGHRFENIAQYFYSA